MNDEQLEDKEFILDLYKRGADINQLPLNKVSKELRADREVVIAAVKQEPPSQTAQENRLVRVGGGSEGNRLVEWGSLYQHPRQSAVREDHHRHRHKPTIARPMPSPIK